MADLTTAVTDMKDRVLVDVGHLQDELAARDGQLADVGAQLITALGNDAADAQTIADKSAEIDSLNAAAAQAASEVAQTVSDLNAFDPLADFPAPTPTEPAPTEPTP